MNINKSFETDANIMLDIESLGNKWGGVVTSIAAVQFCPVTGETFDTFKRNINIQSAINRGMKVDGRTLEWWFNQSQEAQKAMLENPIAVEDAISDLSSWASKIKSKDGKTYDRSELYWWANGAGFDFTLVEACYTLLGKSWVPWHYRNVVDMRTLRILADFRAPSEWYDEITQHDALADCILQIKVTQKLLEVIGS